MSDHTTGWGIGPGPDYQALAGRFRPVFQRIREAAVSRDLQRRLPHEEVAWLREAGFSRVRLPLASGGAGATLPQLFALLIELGAADSNVVNAVRAHLGFVEDLLNAGDSPWRARWLPRVAEGALIGSGHSETGGNQQGAFNTRLEQRGGRWLLNGRKFYTTGSLFAQWIQVVVDDADGGLRHLLVPTDAAGVQVLDDWDGFGQALTASGTAVFHDVEIRPEWINPEQARFPYAAGFYQLVHLATLAGIARAAADDVAQRVRLRDRSYSHGNTARVSQDPQILQVVGQTRSAAYGAAAVMRQVAEAQQQLHRLQLQGAAGSPQAQALATDANIELNQAVPVVSGLVLDATTRLFDALGSSAALRSEGLDRYWRNARTIASHNPRVYRERIVGDYAVNGSVPPLSYRVGSTGQPAVPA